MSALLSVNKLTAAFNHNGKWVAAIHDVSFTVNEGETVAIVGESGSGKSITALSILQLLNNTGIQYQKGNILYTTIHGAQVSLLDCDANALRKLRGNEIAIVFQEPMTSLNPLMTCGAQIEEAIIQHAPNTDARKKAIQLLHDVQLPDPEKCFQKYPHELSGGQKQRVMIAMAMSCNPRLLIADEPTTALDVLVQKEILLLLKKLQQAYNMAMVFISHDLALTHSIADKVIVMQNGQIVEQGTVNSVFRKSENIYTKALLMCRPALYSKGTPLPVVQDFLAPANKNKVAINTEVPIVENYTTILEAKNLTVHYGAGRQIFKALSNVSLRIRSGENLGLVGASGSGKSTLGRAILRLLPIAAGDIIFKGDSIMGLTPDALRTWRKKCQLIFQDPYASLNPRMMVGNMLEEVLQIHRIGNKRDRKGRVVHMLEQVNLLADHYYRYPHEFSGGQRQRIGIARALIMEPELVVCDESVSALDVSVQAQVLNLLNELKLSYGFTTLFISHDLAVVKYMCDRIAVMHNGEIVELDEAEQVYNHPKTDYAQKLVAAVPNLES